jgi:glycosyltransferase involved in cell wall biosynthesis
VTVAHPAADARFAPAAASDSEAVRERYGLPSRFLLTVGSREPRKNLAGVIRAYAALPSELRATCPLVVIGQIWAGPGLDPATDSGIIDLGYVPEADLPVLYAAASVFVFLSVYEGFGLPVLEAMASGTPVVCSNRTSLPEVAGDAAA